MKHYMGFAIRLKEDESGIFFKRKKTEEIFCRITVSADSFAKAQEKLCDEMPVYKISVAFIFPYVEEDTE